MLYRFNLPGRNFSSTFYNFNSPLFHSFRFKKALSKILRNFRFLIFKEPVLLHINYIELIWIKRDGLFKYTNTLVS